VTRLGPSAAKAPLFKCNTSQEHASHEVDCKEQLVILVRKGAIIILHDYQQQCCSKQNESSAFTNLLPSNWKKFLFTSVISDISYFYNTKDTLKQIYRKYKRSVLYNELLFICAICTKCIKVTSVKQFKSVRIVPTLLNEF
jgi:hypothetical protein